MEKSIKKGGTLVAIATHPNTLKFVGVAVLAYVIYETKAFGLLKPKGQPTIDVEKQDDTVFVQNSQGVVTPQTVPTLTAGEAENIAIGFHDTMSKAWDGLGTGWLGWSPSVEEYNVATGRLIGLSNQQLAQVVNAYATKYKTDTYNTVRSVLGKVSCTTASCIANKTALLGKLTAINA